jgi:hypothetical protein
MADCFPGEITIGGKIPAALLQEFLGELNSTGAKVGAYDGPAFACKTAADLRQVLDENGRLFLASDRAPNGQFAEMEDFCVRHGIPHRGEEVVAEGGQRLDFGSWKPDDFGTDEDIETPAAEPVAERPRRPVPTWSDVCRLMQQHCLGPQPPQIVPPTLPLGTPRR